MCGVAGEMLIKRVIGCVQVVHLRCSTSLDRVAETVTQTSRGFKGVAGREERENLKPVL